MGGGCWRTVKRLMGGAVTGLEHEVGSGRSKEGGKKVGRCQDGTMRSDPGPVLRQQAGHVISSSPNQHPADQLEVDIHTGRVDSCVHTRTTEAARWTRTVAANENCVAAKRQTLQLQRQISLGYGNKQRLQMTSGR